MLLKKIVPVASVAPVYKIVFKKEWDEFISSGNKECRGFGNDLKDGFIHLSTHSQLYDTYYRRYRRFSPKTLNLLAIDVGLSRDLRWESASNGLTYPHLYSGIILDENLLWTMGLDKYQFSVNGL